jgi:hypothetical protein
VENVEKKEVITRDIAKMLVTSVKVLNVISGIRSVEV